MSGVVERMYAGYMAQPGSDVRHNDVPYNTGRIAGEWTADPYRVLSEEMGKAMSGEAADLGRTQGAVMQVAATGSVVPAKPRGALGSTLGETIKYIHGEEKLKNLEKFIENSAVKNPVYHGTSSSGFDVMDTGRSKYGLFGLGGYHTESASVASEYTKKGRGSSPGVLKGYVNIKNPIDMDAAVSEKWSKLDVIKEYGVDLSSAKTNEDAYRLLEEALSYDEIPLYEGAEIMQNALRDMGFDGITHIGGGRVSGSTEKHRVWIHFEPEQYKSAWNSGSFDPMDPNFLKSSGVPLKGKQEKKYDITTGKLPYI